MNKSVYTIKLKNGEHLLAEVLGIHEATNELQLTNMLQLVNTPEGIEVKSYFPFSTADKEYTLSFSDVRFIDTVDTDSAKFYASSLVQMRIEQIKTKAYRKMTGNIREDYFTIFDSLQDIKKMASVYTEKYGIEPPNLEDMEEQLEKHKPIMH